LYAHCIFIDYLRASDTINQEILIRKLMSFAIPRSVIKWIASFLSGRTQAVSSDGKRLLVTYNAKHCSVFWYWAVFFTSILLQIPRLQNQLRKYADDTTLIIPQNTDVSVEEEIHHV
jgi:Reverse transcriptase (RNA-dependent DNA polymerase)